MRILLVLAMYIQWGGASVPRVSVVMTCYNEAPGHLAAAIASVLGQTYTDFELLVVDDASDVDCSTVFDHFTSASRKVRVTRNQKNLGLATSLNRALEDVSAPLVARHDADDLSFPNRFENQVQYFDSRPDCVLVGTYYLWIDENSRIMRFNELPHEDCDVRRFMAEVDNPFAHGSVMMQREAIAAVDGYAADLAFAEDYDLWVRMQARFPLRMVNLPQYLYAWRNHGGSMSSGTGAEAKRLCVDAIRQRARALLLR